MTCYRIRRDFEFWDMTSVTHNKGHTMEMMIFQDLDFFPPVILILWWTWTDNTVYMYVCTVCTFMVSQEGMGLTKLLPSLFFTFSWQRTKKFLQEMLFLTKMHDKKTCDFSSKTWKEMRSKNTRSENRVKYTKGRQKMEEDSKTRKRECTVSLSFMGVSSWDCVLVSDWASFRVSPGKLSKSERMTQQAKGIQSLTMRQEKQTQHITGGHCVCVLCKLFDSESGFE